MEQVVGTEIKRLVSEDKEKRRAEGGDEVIDEGAEELLSRRTLKGLSFRKQRKRVREEKPVTPVVVEPTKEPEEAEEVERPRKKARKTRKVIEELEIESEDEAVATPVALDVTPAEETPSRKRSPSVVQHVEEPPSKKAKLLLDELPSKAQKKTKKSKKQQVVEPSVDEVVHEVIPDELDYIPPVVAQVRFTPPPEEEEESRPPTPAVVPPKRTSGPKALVDALDQGICEDDEDMYFARLALAGGEPEVPPVTEEPEPEQHEPGAPPRRVHVTGSARTEGYYKISHAEKSAYVAQYANRSTTNEASAQESETPQPQAITSSRSNRANARRRAQGLEEINQVQRAMALSKGESAATELVKFNQLQTRKKHLRFARSPIHDWGLYAMEKISRGEMVIEYVGEIIRAQVADKREKAYERQGIGSSYLFRIDEDLVVDATKKGNLGRLINHSCDPNCTAKIITINGEKKIVIYAKQDIELGSEITYDYHFPIEQDKIPCLCGSVKCRGYLN
ncbi:hypothetical protein QCA50_013244 [Cerrena zonata]|uniref:Histone-lysine N-methyltransferase, H3 lysine-4 specific n=1 Tax=Cerrena zonata TaxID=2478898 RepID=A0AAW0G2K8_9APHY